MANHAFQFRRLVAAFSLAICCAWCAIAAAQPPPSASPAEVELLLQRAEAQEAAGLLLAAEAAWLEADGHLTASHGKKHPLSLLAACRLGSLHFRLGQLDRAQAELAQAVEISLALYGPLDEEHLACASSLASVEQARGDYARALQHLLMVARRSQEQHGDQHPSYATALNNLAGVYQSLGDLPRATAHLQQAVAIRQETLGDDHADTLTALNNLAGLHLLSGELVEAQRIFGVVADARRKALGNEHPDYATSLNNLAAADDALHHPDEAERRYREALRIRERVLGPRHPDVAASLNNLAPLLRARGQTAAAETHLRQALEIREQALGRWHPDYAASLNNLAVHYRECGEDREAVRWYRQALAVQQRFIDATLPALAEQQQITVLAAWRRTLDGLLSVAPRAEVPAQEVYGHVLWWKGRVLMRQLARRRDAAGNGPALDQLRAVSGQLAALALSTPATTEPGVHERRLQELAVQREQLEVKLAVASGEPVDAKTASPVELAAALPAGVVLIDFLEYHRSTPHQHPPEAGFQPRTELAAFISRHDSQVDRIELGPVAEFRDRIDAWRRTCGAPGRGADAGQQLRERLWKPLAKYVENSRVVLASPDGCLTRLPLAALPGKEPGTYLLEEHALAIVPVPQLLPALLAHSPSHDRPVSLLLVGDIDYGAKQSAAAGAAAAPHPEFDRLAAARSEMLTIRNSFEDAFGPDADLTYLKGTQASENAFRGACSEHRFVHLVTHGFVADSAFRSLAPGLTAGLSLAGANHPGDDALNDGILTGAEAADLDLRGVELVVLSACETGLGPVAAGEGVLGLQRAFQVGGARTVVASLWKVDDRATQEMMELFYERLWSSGDPLSRIEALRRAQLAMLRGEQTRGLGLVARDQDQSPPRRPPAEWAAFVLSGDWR